MSKTCTKCGEEKPLDEYYKHKLGKNGLTSYCKPCNIAKARKWTVANLDRAAKRQAHRYASNPHIKWEARYRTRAKRYGLEPVVESFTKDELIARYGNKCFHCNGPFEELDHFPLAVLHGGPHTLENTKPSCLKCNRPGRIHRLNKTDIGETA